MNYLGIDYGAVKTGVALATGPLAEPLTTVKTEKALQSIKLLLGKHNIDSIVVGDCPDFFLDKLSDLAVVHQADETLSSHDARQFLFHTSQKKRRVNEHAVSAAIILQNWLDSNL
ncbi:MAG: RuvX/YqgF family protein [Patescibacteria group bacterium]